jgi:adenylate cyclase
MGGMDQAQFAALGRWVTNAGLVGKTETMLVAEFCRRLVEAGLPLARGIVIIDTLHPVHEGRAFRWRRGESEASLVEYGRTNVGEAAANWQRSPFFHLLQGNGSALRRRLGADRDEPHFPVFDELRGEGMTDYLALVSRFAAGGIIGEMDCVYSQWVSDAPQGFSDDDLARLQELVPHVALAVKCGALRRIAETLVETYLGRDAGRRVLSGRIERGVADRIQAVLWFSDLRGYTGITDTTSPEQIIPLLNDYADAVVSAIHDAGGDVLKLMGDGTLAIFPADDRALACRAALGAAGAVRRGVAELNLRRAEAGLPTTHVYLGLHVGEVYYGNVGSADRLDFTVVGPAVNEVSRIAALCRSAEREVLLSAAFAAAAAAAERSRIVSVGRYALRGVRRPQELFTVEPEEEGRTE